MGLLDFLTKRNSTTKVPSSESETLTAVDKERIMVARVTTQDMVQFTSMPYHLDCEVKKSDAPQSHPFAYIDLDRKNISVAEAEMTKLNVYLAAAHLLCSKVPKNIGIPVKDIVYKPPKNYGYTRLMCTPYTFTGKLSKFPLSLSFMTDLSKMDNSTHGKMHYGQDGRVQKAEVYCWRRGKGYFFYFKTEGRDLVISKIETADTSGIKVEAYKRPSVK